MRAPRAETGVFSDDPVSAADGGGAGAGGEDLEACFVAGDGAWEGGTEAGGSEGGFGRVCSLDLVDVGGVERGGKGAEGEEGGVRGGDGVGVEARDGEGFSWLVWGVYFEG